MSPVRRGVALLGRGEHSLQDQRSDRTEPLGEQLVSQLKLGELRGHQGHQSAGGGGQRSAGVRLYRKVLRRCRALVLTSGCAE